MQTFDLNHFVRYALDYAQKRMPPGSDPTKVLAELLSLTRNAVYKKMTGVNPFSLEEMFLIVRKYEIPVIDYLQPHNDLVIMRYGQTGPQPIRHSLELLQNLLQQSSQLVSLTRRKLYYASTEIPIFHYLRYPELTAFKLFAWNRIAYQSLERNTDVALEDLLRDPAVRRLREGLLKWYVGVEGVEIYNPGIFDNTIAQIRHYAELGVIKDSGFLAALREQALHLSESLKRMAALGHKILSDEFGGEAGAPLHLYYNRIVHTNNTVLFSSDEVSVAFLTFDNPNFLTTTQPTFVAESLAWFTRLQQRSTLISNTAEVQREQFFRILEARIALAWDMP